MQNLTLAIFRTFGYIKSADIRIKNLTLPIDRACHFTSKVTGRVFYHFAFEKSYDRKTEILMGFCRIIPSPGQEHFSRRKNRKNFFCISGYIDPGEAKKPLGPHVKSQYFGGYGQKSKTGYTKSAISRLKIDFVNYRCDSPER